LLAGQTFAQLPAFGMTYVYRIHALSNMTVRGGYKADPGESSLPGPQNPSLWTTVVARLTSGGDARVLYLSRLTNAVIEDLTIRDGRYDLGGGIQADRCVNLTLNRCILTANAGGPSNPARGGGLGVTGGGSVIVTNCRIVGNATLNGFDYNYARGGGIYLDSGTLWVLNSMITSNTAYGGRNYQGEGGGIYVNTGAVLEVRESVLLRNEVSSNPGYAGYFSRGGGLANMGGIIRLCNVVLHDNRSILTTNSPSSGLFSMGGTSRVENCTVVFNDAGKTNSVGIRMTGGICVVSNSIVWGHVTDLAGFPTNASGVLSNVWFSDIGDGQNAGVQGCLSVNPGFADTNHFHLASKAGYYRGGYFDGGEWDTASFTSPLLDAGDPLAPFSREPSHPRGRLEMGAYGNTPVASKTEVARGTILIVR